MLMLVPVASHDQKVMFHFCYLDVMKGMVTLMTLLASCDTDTSTNVMM